MHRASADWLHASCWVAMLLDVLTRVGPETVERFAYEEEPLSRFLVTVAILEAVFGSPDGASASWLHRDRLSGDLGPLQRLPFAPWRGFPEGATFYASDDLLAVSCLNPTPESDEYLSVWVGTHDQSALSALDSVMDESWEYDSRREH